MGHVYHARDVRLGRPLAIKLLSSEKLDSGAAVARLRREAEAASSLNHPAIVTIYDIGEAPQFGVFIAMEWIDGVNLRRWLSSKPPASERLGIVAQVADGLAAAHAHGIIHRDVKPENIMVSRAGLAKLVDFGLAKPLDPMSTSGSTDAMITARGGVVGTLAYMSPEQLAGEPLDARSDIYAFGCVLRDVFGTNDPAAAPVIARCLQRDRTMRYQSMDAVILDLRRGTPRRLDGRWVAAAAALVVIAAIVPFALRRTSAAGPLQQASVAVLPFQSLGPQSQSYIADGISDALTTDLARQSGLTVIASNSARRYGPDSDLRKASEELRVRYLLVGSVQLFASQVRINARLVDASNAAHVWADHYESSIGGIFSAEDAVVRAVAARLTPLQPRAVAQPSDPRAADLYLRARFFAGDSNWAINDRSIPLLEQVVQIDEGFLPAHIALAKEYQRKAFELDPDRSWASKAFVELQKIMARDPSAAVAYVIRADLHWNRTYGFAHREALADLDRAIRLDPNLVDAYDARGGILMHIGLLDEAMSDFQKALRLDPFNNFAAYRVPRIHWYQQKCAQAAAEYENAARDSDFEYPVTLQCAGRPAEALGALDRITAHEAAGIGVESDLASARAVIFAAHGKRADALAALRQAIASDRGGSHRHHAMYFIAAAYAQLGDAKSALDWLERTSHEGMPCYPLFARDHFLDPIRSDPRIQAFLDVSRQEWEQRRRERRAG